MRDRKNWWESKYPGIKFLLNGCYLADNLVRKALTLVLASDTGSQCCVTVPKKLVPHMVLSLIFYRREKETLSQLSWRVGTGSPDCYGASGSNSDFHPRKARTQWRTKIYLPSALMGLALEVVFAYCLSCWCLSHLHAPEIWGLQCIDSSHTKGWVFFPRWLWFFKHQRSNRGRSQRHHSPGQAFSPNPKCTGRGTPFYSEIVLFGSNGLSWEGSRTQQFHPDYSYNGHNIPI